MSDYPDETLKATLLSGVPRILTTRQDGVAVYVALNDAGDLVEVEPS